MKYETELNFIKEQMRLAFEKFGNDGFHTSQKSTFDLVTDIDINIEKFLSSAIRAKFPKDRILGEEFSSSERLDGRTWTIDPIDGTCNMANGSKLYGMQCSLICDGTISLAVVYLPHFNEWIYATEGSGCYCNGVKITVASDVAVNNAIISYGDYPHTKNSYAADAQHAAIKILYGQIAKIRMFGAACMDFSFVAQGRSHGTVVITRNIWDIAPGILLCREAGAIVSNLNGLDYKLGDNGVMVAANAEIFNLMRKSMSQRLKLKIQNNIYEFDACIFDFDGVVMDTEKYHLAAWRDAFSSVGVELGDKEYAPLKSTGRNNIISFAENKLGKKIPENTKNSMAAIKDKSFRALFANISENDFIGNVKNFLGDLNQRFIKTAVASSASTTSELINKFGLENMFNAVIDGKIQFPKKPASDIFVATANTIKSEPKKCLVFEDSIAGIEAALNCGMSVIAVGGIKHNGALLCIDDFSQLSDYIQF